MNLHAAVRAVIPTVNPDITVTWRRSNGYQTDAAGKQEPQYLPDLPVQAQVQSETYGDTRHADMLNIGGLRRAVYLFGDVEGVVIPDAKGGDLLLFPAVRGGPVRVWKVWAVSETWTPDVPGWCRVLVVDQGPVPIPEETP